MLHGDNAVAGRSPGAFVTVSSYGDSRSRECGAALWKLNRLFRKACKGDYQCYQLLLYATTQLVSWLNAASEEQPDFRNLHASHSMTWPTQFPYARPDVERVYDRLKKGCLGFFFDKLDVPKVSSALQLYAIMLILYIRLLRCGVYSSKPSLVRECRRLDRLSDASAPAWWDVAHRILVREYENLTQLEANEVQDIAGYPRLKSVKATDTEILSQIESWFNRASGTFARLPEKIIGI